MERRLQTGIFIILFINSYLNIIKDRVLLSKLLILASELSSSFYHTNLNIYFHFFIFLIIWFLPWQVSKIDNPHIPVPWPHGYLLKIMNSLDSKNISFVDAQNQLMLHIGKFTISGFFIKKKPTNINILN